LEPENREAAEQLVTQIERHEHETPFERAARHYIDNKIKLTVAKALLDITAAVEKLQAEVEKQGRWLEGAVDADGKRTPGMIDTMATFKTWKNWVLILLGGILTSTITNTVHSFLSGKP
jgi:hypothetical protein